MSFGPSFPSFRASVSANNAVARSSVVRSNLTTGITTIDHYTQRQIRRGGVALFEVDRTAEFLDVLIAPHQDPELTTVQSFKKSVTDVDGVADASFDCVDVPAASTAGTL